MAVLAAGAAGCAYLYDTDPHRPGQLLLPCPFHLATGLLCPACGGTRVVYDLMHGHVAAAWSDNSALLLTSPYAVILLGCWIWSGLRGRRWHPRIGRRTQAAILVAAVMWMVVRNIH
jgi:hypothetical protein